MDVKRSLVSRNNIVCRKREFEGAPRKKGEGGKVEEKKKKWPTRKRPFLKRREKKAKTHALDSLQS